MTSFLRDRYPSDIAGMLPLKLVGCHRVGTNVVYRRRAYLIWLCLAAALIAWQTAIAATHAEPWREIARTSGWSVYFVLATGLMIAALHVTTQRFLDLSLSLDGALTRRGRTRYAKWYAWSARPEPQWTAGIALAVVAVVALAALNVVLDEASPLAISFPSYIVVALCGFFVGMGVFWVATCIVLCVLWAKRGMLRLYRLSPAHTPGVEALSRLVLHTLFGGVILSGVFLVPALVGTSFIDAQSVSSTTQTVIIVVRGVLLALCGLTVVAVGIVPQEALSSAIRDQRHASMRSLLHQISNPPSPAARLALEERYHFVATSPTSTLGSGNVVQIVVAGATALLPFALSFLIR